MARLRVPLFPLGTVLFPGGPLALRIFERRYLDMIGECLRSEGPFAVSLITQGSETGAASTSGIGTLVSIVDFDRTAEGILVILACGGSRFRRLGCSRETSGLYVAEVQVLPPEPASRLAADDYVLREVLTSLLDSLPEQYSSWPRDYDNATWVSYRLAELLPLPAVTKQALLEMDDASERLELLRPAAMALRQRVV